MKRLILEVMMVESADIFFWLRPLLVVLSGLAVGGIWWGSWQKQRVARRKMMTKGVDVSLWTRPSRSFPNTAGVPDSLEGKLLIAFITIVIPIICFAIARDSNLPLATDAWQSGPERYPEILLGRDTTTYFYPFALYGMVSVVVLLVSPGRFSRYFLVRLGIYTGTILALQYMLLLLSQFILVFVAGMAAVLLLPYAVVWMFSHYCKRVESSHFFWTTALVFAWFVGALPWLANDQYSRYEVVMILGVWFLIGAIGWVLPFGWWLSKRLFELEKEWTPWRLGVISVWGLGYGVAWYGAIVRMFEIYNALPTEPPSCYVATAAAQGDPRLVGALLTVSAGGERFRVNRQLQRLKGLELVLLALAPQTHESVRRVYDVVGRKLAGKIRHPAVATLAYWSLKPVEWGMVVVLWGLGSKCRGLVDRFYR